jgi:hypothetical protein
MRKARHAGSPSPAWAVQSKGLPGGAGQLADRAMKLYRTRTLIWRGNLTLVGILIVAHVAVKLIVPGFAAAEYLTTEIGLLEAATLIITRRMRKREERLKNEYLGLVGEDS